MHLAPPQRVIPVEFRGDLWRHKTRVPELLCGIFCVILHLAVLVEHQLVTNGRRQTQTDMNTGPWLVPWMYNIVQ